MVRAGAHRSGLSLAWDVILGRPWFSHLSAALSRFATLVTCLWYSGVAGDGLRSVGVEALPPSKGACSILPTVRHLRAGALGHFTRPGWSEGRGIALRPFATISAGPG
jgi:hypothetical protein